MVGPGVDVLVQVGIDGLLVLQPFHLQRDGEGTTGSRKRKDGAGSLQNYILVI